MISKLKEAREASGYTIEDVAKKLNIRKKYLIALEEEDYESIPGKIYVEGYTKMYYEFLGIEDPKKSKKPSLATKIIDNGYINKKHNKYKKYIILCSVVLLIATIKIYNFLKHQDALENTIQLDDITNATNEEISDRPYQAN